MVFVASIIQQSMRNVFPSFLVILIAVTFWMLAPSAGAKEMRYKDYPIEVRDGDRLVFSGIKINVRLVPSSKPKLTTLRVKKTVSDKASAEELIKFESLGFNVRREGSAIFVEAKGPESKSSWSHWLKPTAPELGVEMEVPAIPVEILAHDGQVTIANFNQAVAVNLINGVIRSNSTEGLLRVDLQNGQISIEKHHGRLEVDSYGAKLAIQDIEGDQDIANFAGETNIARAKGNIDIKSHAGLISIIKSTGSVDFLASRGALNLSEFEGPVRGQTDQGAVSIGVAGDADVHVEANLSTVTVKLPGNSGALLRLQTEEGSLTVPDAIKPTGGNRARIVNGRLPGDGPKGIVSLKSKAGVLRVRL